MKLPLLVGLFLIAISFWLNAEEISLSALKSDGSSASPKIDWSKPVVSRGFGLNQSSSDSDSAALKQYQSGQVFYFFRDFENAIKKWEPLLALNYPEAQASMGWLYQAGLGVSKNLDKARELYTKAARQNNAIAQNNLGVMYENGLSTQVDLEKAIYWYEQSADKGYRYGQYNFANLMLTHKKANAENSKVRQMLSLASDQGVVQAQELLQALNVSSDQLPE